MPSLLRFVAGLSCLTVSATLSGCWLLTADLDLVDGTASAAGPDAADGGDDGSNDLDAGIDARVDATDATDATDASADAGGYCAMFGATHGLCDDFDVGLVGAKWSRVELGAGGLVSLISSPVKSAPRAMRVLLPSPCSDSSAQLIATKSAAPTSWKVGFDLSLGAAPANTIVNLAGIGHATAAGAYRADVGIRSRRLELYENDIGGTGFSVRGTSGTPIANDVFVRVELEFIFVGATRKVVATVDGVKHLDLPISPTLPSVAQSQLELGAYANSGCELPFEARFDNVVYDFVPR